MELGKSLFTCNFRFQWFSQSPDPVDCDWDIMIKRLLLCERVQISFPFRIYFNFFLWILLPFLQVFICQICSTLRLSILLFILHWNLRAFWVSPLSKILMWLYLTKLLWAFHEYYDEEEDPVADVKTTELMEIAENLLEKMKMQE